MVAAQRVFRRPRTMRSRLMLEIASELVAGDVPGLEKEWPYHQVEIRFREQGGDDWRVCFFASDAPNAIDAIMSREATVAICNPGAVLAMAFRGVGPFQEPLPLRAIMVIPQFDQLGFGVTADTGLATVSDIRRRRYPLKVSLRGQRDHSVHMIANQVFRAHGFSLEDIASWGGEVRYDNEMPNGRNRIGAVERGEINALIDEAMPMWGARALDLGMRFLEIDEPHLRELEAMGLRRVAISKEEWPELDRDIWTVDFSGWPVFCREDLSDDFVRAFCVGLEARKDRIPWYGVGPLRLDLMVTDAREAPLTIPLHHAAERFWRERGYIR